MNDTIKLPEDCTDMRDVRRGVDATDRELMKLLERRFGYMRAAARIKTDRNVVRDEAASGGYRNAATRPRRRACREDSDFWGSWWNFDRL